MPALAALLGVPVGDRFALPDLTPRRQKALTFEVLLEHLAGLAARQPVLILYEDLHWVDPTTLELLDLVVGRIEQQRVLVVATCRPEWAPRWIGHPNVSLLSINRLSRAQTAAIVDGLTQGRPLPAAIREQILARTDGVPLFVEELTRAVLDSDLLGEGAAGLGGTLPPLAIPATLQDSLMARLDRLAPVKEVAQTGAVIGREFSFELLAAVSPLPRDELSDALDQLVAADLVFQRGTPPEATYVYKHGLVQDAAYGSLLRSRRQVLHARIAAALEKQVAEPIGVQPEVVAHHWANAGLPDRAIDHWAQAGQHALGRSATTEARGPLQCGAGRAGASCRRASSGTGVSWPCSGPWAAPWSPRMASPRRQTGRAYERALELTERLGELSELFPVLYGLCLYHLYGAELAAANADAQRLIDLAEAGNDHGFLFFAHRAAGVSALPAGRFAEARTHLERALSLYRPKEHRAPAFVYAFDPRVVCLDYLARSLLPLGQVAEALARQRRGARRGSPARSPQLAVPAAVLWGDAPAASWATGKPFGRCRKSWSALPARSGSRSGLPGPRCSAAGFEPMKVTFGRAPRRLLRELMSGAPPAPG